MADRDIIGVEVIFTDRADDHLPRVNPDPHLEWETTFQAGLVTIPPHLFLHAQGGIEGALRMILMGNRCPEQGKDAVAECLGNISFVPMHGLHHQL